MSPQRPLLLGLLLAFLALAWPSTAAAAPREPLGYPGQQPWADTQLNGEIQIAQRFWAARNVIGCPDGIKVDAADNLTWVDSSDPWAAARGGNCRIVVARDAMTILRRRVFGRTTTLRTQLWPECVMVIHEVGHALGLEHTPTGMMSPDFDVGRSDVPLECVRWTKAVWRAHRLTVARWGRWSPGTKQRPGG